MMRTMIAMMERCIEISCLNLQILRWFLSHLQRLVLVLRIICQRIYVGLEQTFFIPFPHRVIHHLWTLLEGRIHWWFIAVILLIVSSHTQVQLHWMLFESITLLHNRFVSWRATLRSILVVFVAYMPTVFHQVKYVQVVQLICDLMNSTKHNQEPVFIEAALVTSSFWREISIIWAIRRS